MKQLFKRILGTIFIGAILVFMLFVKAWDSDKFEDEDDYYEGL